MKDASAAAGAIPAAVLCEIRNHVAFITLNRPAALNALTLGMVVELREMLARHAADPDVYAVLLEGAGGKAFCAGGDIRAVYESYQAGDTLHHAFFATEYPLDHALHVYPKPFVAVLDGITMGGGMGLAQGSRLRVVGDRTRIAMPEVGIGLFPDVGGSYFLSRLSGALGMYLALTGSQIRAADAVYAGLADFRLGPSAIASLREDLGGLGWSADRNADVRAMLAGRVATDVSVAPLSPLHRTIDRHFSHASVSAILSSLDAETSAEHADWARQTAALMRTRSPTMMSVAHRQLTLGKSMTLADCLRMELGMVEQCFVQGDFMEGVRALIIDKDNAPRWNPGTLDAVANASVDAFFEPHWPAGGHPLAGL